MTDNKESIFSRAIEKIYVKLRPALWRAQYRIIHRMRDRYDMSEIPAAWNIAKLGLLANPHGRRFKRTVRKIRDNMFDAIIDNNDELLAWNFHLATIEERMEFTKNTLMTMHKKMSAEQPDIRPVLKHVVKESNPVGKNIHGLYFSNATISMTELGLSQELNEVADTMAHEYTHALQRAKKSALPPHVLDFIHYHWRGYKWTPYLLRPQETEAYLAGTRVGQNFEDKFTKYFWANARD